MVNDCVLVTGLGLGLTIPILDIEGVRLVVDTNRRTRRIKNAMVL